MNKTAKISALSLSILLLGAGAAQLAAAADEHARPEATRADRPQARPAPGRPGFDGRGQVLDSRYNHGRYYPPFGTVRPSLPEGYRPYYRGGSRFYFSGGIWYAPSGPGFVVVRPPAGLTITRTMCTTHTSPTKMSMQLSIHPRMQMILLRRRTQLRHPSRT